MSMKSLIVKHDSELHKKLVKQVSSRIDLAKKRHTEQHDRWTRAEEVTMAYIHASDEDRIRKNRRDLGTPVYTTIKLPYTFSVLMSSHTYWTSVFFARSPIHQFSGRHGEAEMQIQAIEALISYQVEVGEMIAPYYIWLYDAGKYGIGILGQYWTEEKISFGSITEIINPETQRPELWQTTQEIDGYKGNKVYNVSPWDFLHDPRVSAGRFQDGEFCAIRCRLGWHQILRRERAGYYINLDQIVHHVTDESNDLGSSLLVRPQMEQIYGEDEKQHPAGAVFWEFYVDLVPREWNLGDSDMPQKWCITITEDLGLIVGASPLGLMHGRFPIDVLEPEVEGYGIFNRGIPEISEAIQNTMDWLINSHFYNVRASLNNQFIVDPSKLVIKDTQTGEPGFIWRLRPEAYGSDINKIYKQIPVTDVTQSHFSDITAMMSFGERATGVNDQMMSVLAAGGRKTATEVRTSTGFGVNRQKTITEYMSAGGFAPHAQKLVQTSQQLYQWDTKLKIVGDLALDAGKQFMVVSPDMIAGFYNLVPVDGTLPVDRMAQAVLWKEILIGMRNMPPQIAMQYDMARIFAWAAQMGGLKNINQFKVQNPMAGGMGMPGMGMPSPLGAEVVPDEALAQDVQRGNVVPLAPPQGRSGQTAGLRTLIPPTPESMGY